MADLSFDVSDSDTFDPLKQPVWTVFTASGTSVSFNMQDGVKYQNFWGSFTYPDQTHVKGTVEAIDFGYWGSSDGFSVSGLHHDAAIVQQKVIGGAGLMEYLLSGNDTIQGGWKAMGFAGNDLFDAHLQARTTSVDGGTGVDTLQVTHWAGARINLLTGVASSLSDTTVGAIRLANVENIRGGTAGDVLTGNAGNNVLDGGSGVDTVSFAGVSTAVTVNLATGTASGHGSDTLLHIENITGGSGADRLSGDALANRLEGGAGVDTLAGAGGNDSYVYDGQDVIVEAANAGTDTVFTATSLALTIANVENLVLVGNALNGTGNALANALTGTALNNVLDGSGGTDTMTGGAGNDTYVVDASTDRVVEAAGGGIDTVRSSASYGLATYVEHLVLQGTAAINGAGNGLANDITGNSNANVLTGGGGVDTLRGGLGNDTYVVSVAGTVIVENASSGVDTVTSSINWTLGANLEKLGLSGYAVSATGNALVNSLYGNALDNRLDGGAGSDALYGGAGNDSYWVDVSTDVVIENANSGNSDIVFAAVSYALANNVERLTLTGTASTNATGNALANLLTGNAGNNRLDGGAGIDTLVGGLGNDTYVVDATGDVVTEVANGGNDTVLSSVSYTLSNTVENLTLTGSALVCTGNNLSNRLEGNAQSNYLVAGLGVDTLIGGGGNDVYYLSGTDDTVVELAGGGTDKVCVSAYTYAYTLQANVENLAVDGDATRGVRFTGNGLANRLEGTPFSDTLDGGLGADTMDGGGSGNDTFYVDHVGDRVLHGNYGDDTVTVYASVSVDLSASSFNSIIHLTGSANLNAKVGYWGHAQLYGNAGDNVLTGGGNGTLFAGGAGNDTYVSYSPTDQFTEQAGQGHDLVIYNGRGVLDLSASSASIEDLSLGSAALGVIGNALDNLITSNGRGSTLDGGDGLDTVSYANSTRDVSVDLGTGHASGDGIDTLISFEGVVGSDWDDTLRGGDGADTLTGGAGADTFVIDNLVAADLITDYSGSQDLLQFVQSGWSIGNGDAVVDGGVAISGPGGFSAAAELVVVDTAITGNLTAAAAAAAIGSATEDYAVGQTALFAVHNLSETAVFLFTSGGSNAVVGASELTRLCTLDTGLLNLNDIGFVTG